MENKPEYKITPKGKIPPQAIDLEIAILGAMIIDQKCISIPIEIFGTADVFYKEQHKHIYSSILEMFELSEQIDLLTVSEKLKTVGKLENAGGDFYLIELTQKISSSAHIEYHCRIVQQMYVKRQAIIMANEIIQEGYKDDGDIFDLMESSYRKMDEVSEWMTKRKANEFPDAVEDFFRESKDLDAKGIPSALTKMQIKLNGYQKSDLIILAARPGMGKTAYMLNEALNAATLGIPVGIFSLEMSERQLIGRLLANYCGVDSNKIYQKKTSEEEDAKLAEKKAAFQSLPININDQQGISPLELNIQASRWKRDKQIQMIFVDYLQLMESSKKIKSGNREQEVSSISRSLKGLAKDMDIPVMALSQLSRSVETRGGAHKRPLLSDLRESGAIEQDADIVMFLYRPEYYKIDTWDDDESSSTAGQAEMNVAKFRGGEVGATVFGSRLKYMQFHDLVKEHPFPINDDYPYQSDADDFKPEESTLPKMDPWNDDKDDLPF